jgi:putative ABC transport system permease protein
MAGLIMGLLLGQALVQLVTRTVTDLYFDMHVTAFLIDPVSLLKGFAMGVAVSLVACSIPAWEASRSQPANVMQRSTIERSWQRRLPALTALGVVCLIAGLLMVAPAHGPLVEGFLALILIVFGFCLLVPGLVVLVTRLLLSVLSSLLGSTARIAIRDINAGISRTGMAVAALTVAVSVTVGVGVMVSSFRQTVIVWLGQYLSGDIYVSTLDRNGSGLTQALHTRLQSIAGVASVTPSRIGSIETEFGPVRMLALTPTENDTRLPLKDCVADVASLFYQGKGVMISEPLAYHQQLSTGDTIGILTATGEQQLAVLGVYYDYTTSSGMIALHREAYRQLWNDERISGLTVYKEDSTDQVDLFNEVRQIVTGEGEQIRVSSNQEIRETALAVFDRTFAITHVLRMLAILVAFVGVLSALMALQLERTKEFAILRATGMTPRQITTMILGQTGLMGLMAGLLSIPLGLLMADILIDVINRRAFGWSLLQQIPPGVIAEALLLALIAAVFAGVYPSLHAASIAPAEALREE